MKYIIVFFISSLCFFYLASQDHHWFLTAVFINIGVAFLSFSVVYILKQPKIFMKNKSGRLNILSYIMHWPIIFINALAIYIYGIVSSERHFDKIDDNLYLGRRLLVRDQKRLKDLNIKAVLDVTSEFGEVHFFRHSDHYLCIPILDKYAPTLEQLIAGVDFIDLHSNSGSCYVHCAMGHGRSTTFVLAYLIYKSPNISYGEHLQKIKSLRPQIGLSVSQRQIIQEYQQFILEK